MNSTADHGGCYEEMPFNFRVQVATSGGEASKGFNKFNVLIPSTSITSQSTKYRIV